MSDKNGAFPVNSFSDYEKWEKIEEMENAKRKEILRIVGYYDLMIENLRGQ